MLTMLALLPLADAQTRVELIGADLARGVIAYREYYSLEDDEEEAIDCAYAGMSEDDATLGIRLVINEKGRNTDTHTIYAPVSEKEACTPMEDSKTALKEAKAAFRAAGIDTKKPPDAVYAVVENDLSTFKLGDDTLTFGWTREDPFAMEFGRRSEFEFLRVHESAWNGKVFRRTYRQMSNIGGWNPFFSHELAFRQGDRIGVIGTRGSAHMRGGRESTVFAEAFDFTHPPVLKELGKPDLPKVGPLVVDQTRVLGLNHETETVAYRVIAHAEPFDGIEVGASINCNYPGQGEFPTSGVMLHTSAPDEPESPPFTVYAISTEPSDCTSQAEAVLGLDKAKAHFAKLGIDITHPPDPIEREDRMFVFDLPGGGTFDVDMDDVDGSNEAYVFGDKVVFMADDGVVAVKTMK